jgi:hypothetical protein
MLLLALLIGCGPSPLDGCDEGHEMEIAALEQRVEKQEVELAMVRQRVETLTEVIEELAVIHREAGDR